jgi:hypothetical protein
VRDQWVTQARSYTQVRRTAFGPSSASAAARSATAQSAVPTSSPVLIGILALVWGCNSPLLKVGVTELRR